MSVKLANRSDVALYPTGSAADGKDCDEILEINGKSPGVMGTHEQIVGHINQVSCNSYVGALKAQLGMHEGSA